MGEASLRQMFVNSHAFIHAHQWVLVVLGLSLVPPPLIKKPNTSHYLHCLRLVLRKSFFLIRTTPLCMHMFIYIRSILALTLHPTPCCGKYQSVYQSWPLVPQQERAPARHGKLKGRQQFVSVSGSHLHTKTV